MKREEDDQRTLLLTCSVSTLNGGRDSDVGADGQTMHLVSNCRFGMTVAVLLRLSADAKTIIGPPTP